MKISFLVILFILTNVVTAAQSNVNDENQYILEIIKMRVWGGFQTPEDVQQAISDLLEGGEDEQMLRSAVDKEFFKKAESEKLWSETTDVDRLNLVFETLKSKGVLCLHNAGYTMSDGHYDANERLADYPKGQFYGYCFYHGQDLERALLGEGLMLAFDHVGSHWVDRRLIFLRGLDNEKKTWIFSRSTGTRGSIGVNHRT